MLLDLVDRDAGDFIDVVTCLNCRVPMRCVIAKLVEGEQTLLEAAYRCPDATPRRGAGSRRRLFV
jgi:hypothetical protein